MLLDAPAFYQLFVEYEGRPLVLEPWQVAFMRRFARFRALEKSVQVGFSFCVAMEALHGALFYLDETTSFVSVNEKDAQEKILYALKLYHGMPEQFQRFVPIAKDSTEEMWLGERERPSRLLSLPASAGMRGRATNIVLDEIDHYRPGQDEAALTAAMTRTLRERRRLTVGSSVFGEETALSRIMAPDGYPDFLKFRLPWTVTTNPELLEGILVQRRNMPPEDFAQEYECVRGDAADSAFPQNLIRRCWHDGDPVDPFRLDRDARFIAGYDPGGSRHPAVLTVAVEEGSGWVQQAILATRGEKLADQQARLDELLAALPGMRLAIDRMGLGQQMAEELVRRWGGRVVPVIFTEASKSEMVLGLKKLMEDGGLRILRNREQDYQLNRTRRIPGGKVIQAGSDRSDHFDRFWALAMAVSLVTTRSAYEDHGLRFVEPFSDGEDDEETDRLLNTTLADKWRRLCRLRSEP